MGMLGVNPHCVECANTDHWIELIVVDEYNQYFDNVKGTLIDGKGRRYPITLNNQPIRLDGITAGRIQIELDPTSWLKQAQQRRPLVMDPTKNQTHDVKAGDTLTAIAEQYGMTLNAILELNPQYQDNPDLIVVGDTVQLNEQYQGDPVDEWLRQYPIGYHEEPRQRINMTAGDLLSPTDAEALPERHQARQAISLNAPDFNGHLISDQCYVVCVQGFNYITLRFGLFFDGTANNTYSAQWGKQQLENYYHQWQSLRSLEGNLPVKDWQAHSYTYPNQGDFYWFWEDDEKVESSAANELTNIQKLYERYINDEYNQDQTVFYHSEYITGIGTGNSTEVAKADESLKGQALGLGEYGVEAKVTTAIDQLISRLKNISDTAKKYKLIDGINKVELDVFGFSRGGGAARHFINVALDGEQGEFVPKFVEACQQNKLALQAGFDWRVNEHCEVTFAGLFDTVAAIADFSSLDFTPHNQDNGNVRLWLDPQRVRHAVHLTASPKTEYRYNFSSNKLNAAENFHEIMVYGAHSDLGGGYYSQYAFEQSEYLLPLIERKRIKRIVRDFGWLEFDSIKQQLEQELQQELDKEVAQGWKAEDYIISVAKGPRRGNNDRQQAAGELILQRLVQGDLSRLYLRVMYGLAESMQVPLSEISKINQEIVWDNIEEKGFIVPQLISGSDNLPAMTFGKLCDVVLQTSKQGNITELATHLASREFLTAFMRYNLIHHSSDDGIANHPNTNSQGEYDREQYDPTV
ncbi:phospholipase effector Tle1 domain-containing protein [Vibrio algivorus]|uniref:LysM peptidoglycan-binding domain-containing protein n=1 Tax=Vibrio algivorus TaxID=1667024 RepID=A0A557NTM3_9VIBR|nr:DUF2235 domain-containing protein [Vibrio algivorus]TVO31780.1 LysM peptidoglycan-binding domain-containing protein [Vibrio algivorus]